MKIIQVHNYYQQAGGEDSVVEAERAMLEEYGDVVMPFYKTNDDIGTSRNKLLAISHLLKASVNTLWNWTTYREFRKLLREEKPDVVHCHNTFPLISPSIYWACAKEKVPVVQTLHNYRLLCLNAFLFRQGKDISHGGTESTEEHEKEQLCDLGDSVRDNAAGSICEACLTKSLKWPGIKYGCYRDSKAGSLVIALMLLAHKLIGTWSKKVSLYIALTEFQKQKMIEGGLPADKIFVKPNFIDDSSMKEPLAISHQSLALEPESEDALLSSLSLCETPYCLFVGRLSPEKGCDVLIRAWSAFQKKLKANSSELSADKQPQLLIVGDGPERESIESLASSLVLSAKCQAPESVDSRVSSAQNPATIHFLGRKSKSEVISLMHNAQFLVSPSVCYETFGLVVLEAGMLETPSIVSEPGTVAGLIDDSETGLLFPMGDEIQLSEKIEWAFAHPKEMQEMGQHALQSFKAKYSDRVNYQQLLDIYRASANRGKRKLPRGSEGRRQLVRRSSKSEGGRTEVEHPTFILNRDEEVLQPLPKVVRGAPSDFGGGVLSADNADLRR